MNFRINGRAKTATIDVPPKAAVRTVAPAFRRGARHVHDQVRVAGGRRASRGMIRLGFSVKSVARYRGLAPVVVLVPPPKGGGCGSFAAYGGWGPLTCART